MVEKLVTYFDHFFRQCTPKFLLGGEKYVNSGILFKFANDIFKIYDNEEGCHKAAGNELKSMLSIQSCCGAELSFPLICVIDYLGMFFNCKFYF